MGLIADIARYHLLVALQRWAGPMLAILCAHEGLRAGALALPAPPIYPSWAPPLTEERDRTRRLRLAAMKVIAQASRADLLSLVALVDARRITVPAAERRLLATLPPAQDLAPGFVAILEAQIAAAQKENIRASRCNQHEHAPDCEKNTGTSSKKQLQSHHDRERTEITERRRKPAGSPPASRPGRQSDTSTDPGGVRTRPQELRRRIHVRQGYRLIAQAVPGAAEKEILKTAQQTAAQLNATFTGRKPAFLESIPGYSKALAKDLPPGVRFAEAGGLECIYHEAAVAKELNLPEGADVDAVVRQKLEAGTYGRLLGYGADTMLERPCHYVSIQRNGEDFFGFISSPCRDRAAQYAEARMQDFAEQFPGEQWQTIIKYLPGDEVKGARCNQHEHAPDCEKNTGTSSKNQLQSHHDRERTEITERRRKPAGSPPASRPGRQSDTSTDPGGVRTRPQELRRRIHVPEVRRRLEKEYGDSPLVFKENLAATVAAQINATLAGAKPAFLETVPGLTAALAKDLPSGVRFIEAGGLECIYHEAAVAKELNLPEGADVDAVVRQKLEAGAYGRLLGYGADTMLERPGHRVSIRRNGEDFFGFISSPCRDRAAQYAEARMQDFAEQFPGEQWQIFIEYLPGDEVKGAHCNQHEHAPDCEKNTGASSKNQLHSHHDRERTRRRGAPDGSPALRLDRQDDKQDERRGILRNDEGLGRRIHVPEIYRRLEEEYGDSPPVEKERLAATAAAQINATLAGAKPAFLETVPGLTAALAKDLPPGVRFIEAGGLECIYHEAAVAKELNLPEGADVDAVVRQKLEAGTYGRLLGYGADTMLERPCHRVIIRRNGENFFGFMSSPSKAKAEKYAEARMQDFTEQFPGEQWQTIIKYLPGDEVKGARCNQKHLPGCPNAHPNANRNAREGETKRPREKYIAANESKDNKKREKRIEKLARTPAGKTLSNLLNAIEAKSETKNYSGSPVRLNEVAGKTRAKIKDLLGIDTEGWSHSISEQQIRHIQSGHSKEISKQDYLLIPEIQKNWNKLKRSDEDPLSLIYTKRFGRKKYTLIEKLIASNKGRARLTIVTFYANKAQ